jgi:nucleoside-diphosphate-sugar epimerase
VTRVLVTGANGFIGSHLLAVLAERGLPSRAVFRTARSEARQLDPHDRCVVGTIDGSTDWRAALEGCETVVHLAACVHVMCDSSDAVYRETNVDATRALARQSAAAGIRRFLFASTVKVHGEGRAKPYAEGDAPAPRDAYARSKQEAEQVLREIVSETGMEATILRIPLVYGPGVGGNFLRLMHAIDAGKPMPFGSVDNRRSLVYVGNLADAIVACLGHPAAAQRTFLISDGEDVSTPELVRRIARALGRRPRILPVPVALLRLAGSLSGRRAEIERMVGSFAVDSGALRAAIGWTPSLALDAGLARTAAWYTDAFRPPGSSGARGP